MGGCSSKSTNDVLAEPVPQPQPEQLCIAAGAAAKTTLDVAPAEISAAPSDVKPDGEEAVAEEPKEAVGEEIAAEDAPVATESVEEMLPPAPATTASSILDSVADYLGPQV